MLTEKIKDLRTQITEQQAYVRSNKRTGTRFLTMFQINRCITAVIAATGTGATSVLFSFVPFVGIATAVSVPCLVIYLFGLINAT